MRARDRFLCGSVLRVTRDLACSLAEDERVERERELAALRRKARSVERVSDGVELRFPDDAAIADEIESLVEAERRCCPFLAIDVSRGPGEIRVTVSGPADAEPLLESALGGG